MDIMFINCLKFLVGTSRHIKFLIENYIPDKSHMTVIEVMKAHYSVCNKQSFIVQKIYMDTEFKDLEDTMNVILT